MGIDARMVVQVPRIISPADVLAESVRLSSAFSRDVFFIMRPGEFGYADGRHALTIETAEELRYCFDDDHEFEGETLISVHLMGRYYGPGYERGDIVTYLAIARWLRERFTPCNVFYGGDSSGTGCELLDDNAADRYWNHFKSEHGRDYFTDRPSVFGARWRVRCDFCQIYAMECMSSDYGKRTGHACTSCGARFIVTAKGDRSATLELCEKYGKELDWKASTDQRPLKATLVGGAS